MTKNVLWFFKKYTYIYEKNIIVVMISVIGFINLKFL